MVQGGPSECRMYWQINRQCNFNCAYCFRESAEENQQAEDPARDTYSPEHMAGCFDQTGKVWSIYVTGGEPLLYPNFVELVQALAHQHYISISTNLSTTNAYHLADTVASNRLCRIMANAHIEQRERLKNGLTEYLRKFLYFQERGFNIELVYVAYPPLFDRIERDLEWFRREGVEQTTVKIFQGRYEDKRYPRDYSEKERSILKGLGLNDREQLILDSHVSFLGKKCQAGHRGFTMDVAGNVTRCLALRERYGNLFEGTFSPGLWARRCTARKCVCAYQGMKLTDSKSSPAPSSSITTPIRLGINLGEWVGRRRS